MKMYQKVNQKRLKNKSLKELEKLKWDIFDKQIIQGNQGRFFKIILIVYRKNLTKIDKVEFELAEMY